jgi:hypothetical protein
MAATTDSKIVFTTSLQQRNSWVQDIAAAYVAKN